MPGPGGQLGPKSRAFPGEEGSLGQHLAYLRVREGWSQADFALACGAWPWTAHRVYRIENDHQPPTLADLKDMAQAFAIPTSELVKLLRIDRI